MFKIDTTVDTVKTSALAMTDAIQKSKKQIIGTFVTNDSYAKTMNDFVDAQTDYTSKAIVAGFDSAKDFLNITSDYIQGSMKFIQPAPTKSK